MKRIPEPALIRSILVAITGVIALLGGKHIDTSWIETAVTVYAAISPIIAGVLIRQAVTPARAGTPEPDETK
ncbi:hypothetical protein [Nocardia australiensis]|uniref:hypothetical protein n=1 Tax=Nocardia australiensis TaxID=2887191 RepID=UPI001D1499F9|nr:hypothetical protein [Nocardia australiensis]